MVEVSQEPPSDRNPRVRGRRYSRDLYKDYARWKEDRAQQHGDFHHNLNRITRLWTVYLDQALDAHDVACMMALLKVSRTLTDTTNPDDYVDLAKYAAIAAKLAEDMPA